jgi:hypothetical protein
MRVRLFAAAAVAALCASGPVLAQPGGAMSEQAARAAADSTTRQFVSAYNAGNPSGIEGPQWRIAMLIGNLKPVRDVTGMGRPRRNRTATPA